MTFRTQSKTDLNKFALTAWGRARNADAAGNHNGYVTRAELLKENSNPKATAALVKVHAAALKSKGLSSAIGSGDFYVYSKSLLTEIRSVMDTKGNQDGKLQASELKDLSAPARQLLNFGLAVFESKPLPPAQ